uniref:E3 ubiquitin-protein ligase n=1 Tax=Parastrongyloides trichosuri TaxID=131310 RepID=A0A0N4ZNW2_PARTI
MNIPTNGQKNNNTPLSYNRKKFINDGNSNNIIEEEEDDKNEGHNKKDIYKSFDYKRNGSPLSGEDNQIELSIYNDSSPSNSYKKNCKKNINTSQSSSISSGVSSLSEASTSSSNKSNCDIALNLPTGFEARVDKNGRIFYIDHINKKTTWTLPIFQEKEAYIDINNRNLHTTDVLINNMDLKYTCTRRTTVKSSNISSSILQPALTFLQRSDFVNVLQTNPEALQIYNSSSYLKHMITRIRKKETTNDDGNKNNMYYYEKFSKNKELINFINLFADKTQPLPYGWQELSTINIHNDSFTKFYANHKTKQITAIDPRLPIEIKKRTRSVPIKKNKFISDDTLTSMTRIYQSIDEIKELVKEHYPESSNRMCKKLNLISKGGEISLLRFANDIDIIQAISLFEEKSKERRDNDNKNNNIKCITNNFGSAFSLFNDSQIHNEEFFEEFKEKVNYFYTSLTRSGYGTGPTKIKLLLRRFFLVEDSFTKILSIDSIQLRKSQFTVSFEDEDGLDYGGPSRELFFLLSRDLFNPYYGLFEYSSPNVYTVTISKNSSKVKNYLKWFELCGRVLGLALMHRCLIDTFFPKPFYKILLGINYIIDDLKDMDQEYYNSLKWISENNITGIIDFNFTASTSINGKITDIDLLPDGSNLKVTEYNKDQYINLLLKHRIERNIQEQIKALLRGLHDVIDSNYLRVFSPSQLSLLLSGTMDIDLEDWRENTEYKSGYFDSHVVINWFWNVVYKLTNAERLKLLKFVTGTSSIPFEGFKGLRGSNGGLKKFTIEKWGDSESLPRAHTCFNRLDLPLYKDQQTIRNKLLIAINESDSYAIE